MTEALSATSVVSPPVEKAGRGAAVPDRAGSFLSAVHSAATPAEPTLAPHPFYNGEMHDPEAATRFWGKDGFGADDFLDIVNPLHHIPLVSGFYRQLSGDEISPASRLAGGALFGGPLGFASALMTGVIEESTGASIGETIVAMVTGEDVPPPPERTAEDLAAIAPASGKVGVTDPNSLIAWTTPRALGTAGGPAGQTLASSTPPSPAGDLIAWTTPRNLGADTPAASRTAKPAAPGETIATISSRPPAPATGGAASSTALPAGQVAQLAAARPGGGPGINPVDLLPDRQPSPLAFARTLLESAPSGSIPTPPPTATRGIIAAEERERQREKSLPDPLSAVLTARSQVPRAGAVPGLDARRATPELAAARPPVEKAPLSELSAASDETALARRRDAARRGLIGATPDATAAETAHVAGKRGAPPERQSASTLESARRRATGTPVPNSMVPKAMMNALDKYETMVQQRNGGAPEPDA